MTKLSYTLTILLLILSFSGFSQTSSLGHTKGSCYTDSSVSHQGKADIDQIYIFNEDFDVVFYKSFESSSNCPNINTTNGHYYNDDGIVDLHLSAGIEYTLRIKSGNPDGSHDAIAYGVWLDMDNDSNFIPITGQSQSGWKFYMHDEGEVKFTLPYFDTTSNFKIRIRTESYANGSPTLSEDNTLTYGETYDFTARKFSSNDLEANFWVPDTVFIGSIATFVNSNPFSNFSHKWIVDNLLTSYSTQTVRHVYNTNGLYSVKLVTKDTVNNISDSITKNIVVINPNKTPIPLFASTKKAVVLFEDFQLVDLSRNFNTEYQYLIYNQSDSIYSCEFTPNNCGLPGGYLGYPKFTTVVTGNYHGAVNTGSWNVCMRSRNAYDSSDWSCSDRVFYVGNDSTPPTITIIGNSDTTINVYTSYTDEGAIAYDDSMGVITDRISTSGFVDTSRIGDYTITYTVSDTAGNTSIETRTVRVRDLIKPVVTLLGDSIILCFERNSTPPYMSDGAVASDNYDTGITADLIMLTNMKQTMLGVYYEKWVVTDSSGNTSDTAIRIIYVRYDCTPPLLTLNGSSDTTISVGSPWNDPGATAIDNKEGDISSSIIVSGLVNEYIPGTYILNYYVQDNQTNASKANRTVHVIDSTPPTIENSLADKTDSCWVVEVQLQSSFVDSTTATDNYDSLGSGLTLTANPASSGGGADVDTRFQGTISVTYTATDSSGNVTTQCINYVVRDYIPPVIDLRTLDTVTHCIDSIYTPVTPTVTDNLYTSSQISLVLDSSNVDVYTLGTYQDVYTATDPAGNISTKARTVSVIDCSTTDIEDLYTSSNFIVYPNPSSGIINIKSLDETLVESIEITNNMGQQVYYQQVNRNQVKIEITSFNAGFYTLNIVSEGISIKKQLIVE